MTLHAVSRTPSETGHPRRTAILMLMSTCATMTISLVAAINLAIPKLSASDLRPSSAELLWIVDAYVLVFACLLIPAGAFGDRHGRKGALLGGLALLAVGCLVSALAPGVGVLLAGRVVTGLGAALVMPASLSLSIQAFPPAQRPHAIATWTAATGLAGIVGNIGGGLVLEYLPWQGLFWGMVPIALVLLAVSARLAPRSERHHAELDLVGSVLLILAFAALLYGIIEGPGQGWASGTVFGAFAVAAVVLTVFTVRALRVEHPLIDPRIFRVARLRASVLGVGVSFFGLFALFFVNAQFLQYVMGYSPILTGVAIFPLAIGITLMSRWSVSLGSRRLVVTAGMIIIAGGLGLLSFAGPGTPYLLYAAYLVVMSVGMGLCVPALSTGVISSLPHGQAGLGSGLNGAAREIGSALGVAVLGTILTAQFTARLPAGTGVHSAGEALATAGAGGHAVTAFAAAVAVGYRVIAVVVLLAGLLVGLWFRSADE